MARGEDTGNHPGRQVGPHVWGKNRDADVAQITKTVSTPAHRYAQSQIRKNGPAPAQPVTEAEAWAGPDAQRKQADIEETERTGKRYW